MLGGGIVKLTAKQKRFCEEYIVDCNATQAAIRAGYSQKTARQIGQNLLTKVDIQNHISDLREQIGQTAKSKILQCSEICETLTKIITGEQREEKIYLTELGEIKEYGIVNQNNQIKSMELLAKLMGYMNNKIEVEGVAKIVFSGEDDLK